MWELYFKLCCASANCYTAGNANYAPRMYWQGGSRYNATAQVNNWLITSQIIDAHNPTTDSSTDSPGAGTKCWNEKLMPALLKQFNLQKPIYCPAAPQDNGPNGTVPAYPTSDLTVNGM